MARKWTKICVYFDWQAKRMKVFVDGYLVQYKVDAFGNLSDPDGDGVFDIHEEEGIKVMAIYNWRSTSKAKFKNFILGNVCPLEEYKGTIEQQERWSLMASLGRWPKAQRVARAVKVQMGVLKFSPLVFLSLTLAYALYHRLMDHFILQLQNYLMENKDSSLLLLTLSFSALYGLLGFFIALYYLVA